MADLVAAVSRTVVKAIAVLLEWVTKGTLGAMNAEGPAGPEVSEPDHASVLRHLRR